MLDDLKSFFTNSSVAEVGVGVTIGAAFAGVISAATETAQSLFQGDLDYAGLVRALVVLLSVALLSLFGVVKPLMKLKERMTRVQADKVAEAVQSARSGDLRGAAAAARGAVSGGADDGQSAGEGGGAAEVPVLGATAGDDGAEDPMAGQVDGPAGESTSQSGPGETPGSGADPAAGGPIDPLTGAPLTAAVDPLTGEPVPAAADPLGREAAGAVDPLASGAGGVDAASGAPVPSAVDPLTGEPLPGGAGAPTAAPGTGTGAGATAGPSGSVDPLTGEPVGLGADQAAAAAGAARRSDPLTDPLPLVESSQPVGRAAAAASAAPHTALATKTCPYCAFEIPEVATRCGWCTSDLGDLERADDPVRVDA